MLILKYAKEFITSFKKVSKGEKTFLLKNYSAKFVFNTINYLKRTLFKSNLNTSYSEYRKTIPQINGTRESFENLFIFLTTKFTNHSYSPKLKYIKKQKNYFKISSNGLNCDTYEAIARTFIGLGFFLKNNDENNLKNIYIDLITTGSDPASKYCWTSLWSNQVIAENTSIIITFLINKDKLWDTLPHKSQKNVINHIKSSLKRPCHANNWLWFKIFHYLFLFRYDKKENNNNIYSLFEGINKLYSGDGWYNDSTNPDETIFDHYNSWAMHYYGLLFCWIAKDDFLDIQENIKKRAQIFFDNYIYFFSKNDLPICWGRSLLYRFSMLSCFGLGIALNIIPEQRYSHIKSITASTINNFLESGILDESGMLNMGFTKPLNAVLDTYSGYGSPYWAFKAFSFLLLPKEHPFWRSEIVSSNNIKDVVKNIYLKELNIYIQNNEKHHNFILNGSINSTRHYNMKYNRFSYSNIFLQTLDEMFIDNSFVILSNNSYFIKDRICKVSSPGNNIIHVSWKNNSLNDLKAFSTIIPVNNGYILISNIICEQRYNYIYSGFNITINSKLDINKKDKIITLSSGDLWSELTSFDNNSIISHKNIPAEKCLNLKPSALPYSKSFFSSGVNKTVLCIRAGRLTKPSSLNIKKNKEGFIIYSEHSQLSFEEIDNFYIQK